MVSDAIYVGSICHGIIGVDGHVVITESVRIGHAVVNTKLKIDPLKAVFWSYSKIIEPVYRQVHKVSEFSEICA